MSKGSKRIAENLYCLIKTDKLFLYEGSTKRVRPLTETEFGIYHYGSKTSILGEVSSKLSTKDAYAIYLQEANSVLGRNLILENVDPKTIGNRIYRLMKSKGMGNVRRIVESWFGMGN